MVILEDRCFFGVAHHNPADSNFYDDIFVKQLHAASPDHLFFELEGTLEDSDVIGVGISPRNNMIVFTQNGVAISAFQHDLIDDRLYFPCVRNVGRVADFNIGQRGGFAFERADSYEEERIEYLKKA